MAIQRTDFNQKHTFLKMPSSYQEVVLVKSLSAGAYSLPRLPSRAKI